LEGLALALPMKVYLHANPNKQHQIDAMQSLWVGLTRHGINVTGDIERADFTVWWNKIAPPEARNRPRLYLEAGYINGRSGHYVSDRLRFISAGWNDLHNAADRMPDAPADRWEKLDIELKPWRINTPMERALLLGQVRGDRCAPGADTWDRIVTRAAMQWKYIRVRNHPLVSSEPPIEKQLTDFDVAVTWASTAAVECVIEGVPTVTLHKSAISWPVTGHKINRKVAIPDRQQWAYNLAYRQWTHLELEDGSAWDWLQQGLDHVRKNAASRNH
jgi:hypothetical protein